MMKSMKDQSDFNEKLEREVEANFNKWKEYDLLTAIIAVLGLALSIVDYEYSEIMATQIINDQQDDCKTIDPPNPGPQVCAKLKADTRLLLMNSNFVRVVILFVSILGVITLILRHSTKTRWLNEDLPTEVFKSVYMSGDREDTTI